MSCGCALSLDSHSGATGLMIVISLFACWEVTALIHRFREPTGFRSVRFAACPLFRHGAIFVENPREIDFIRPHEQSRSQILRRADDGVDRPALPVSPPPAHASRAALYGDGDSGGDHPR